MSHDPSCVFCKIAAGQIPSRKVYEDEDTLAFHDINPWAPVHFLIIPKAHIASLAHTTPQAHEALLGKLLALAPVLAKQEGITNGFRLQINTGEDGHQEVPHLHLHVIGGPRPWRRG